MTDDMKWRVGGKVPLNVYEGDRPMFQCHTPEDAERIVSLLTENANLKALADINEQCARIYEHKQPFCEHENRYALTDDGGKTGKCVMCENANLKRDKERLGFYVASRASVLARGTMWRAIRDSGVRINSSWIDEDGEGQTQSFSNLWLRIESEIKRSAALILYAESEDFPLKGAYIEVGMALAFGIPVCLVLPGVTLEARSSRPIGSWIAHPLVSRHHSVCEAIAAMQGKSAALDSVEAVGDDFTGWVIGNNYKQRGKLTKSTGAVHNEPWYITADGKLWSAFDVNFRPDTLVPSEGLPIDTGESKGGRD